MTKKHPPPPLPEGESLAEYVTKVREWAGLTKTELARRANVNISTVHRLESGDVRGQKVKRDVQNRLAAALRIPVAYLKAAASGALIDTVQDNLVCPSCWTPGTLPDSRWSFSDAQFCLRCGTKLINQCTCGKPISVDGKFCGECGQAYSQLK